MSIKYPFSHHGRHNGEEDKRREHDGHHGARGHESGQNQRDAAKGHAAYAAEDKKTSQTPHAQSFDPAEGAHAHDAAGPAGHGEQADRENNVLAEVSQEALQAECAARVCPECQVKKEADDARLRALAELDNAKKRLSRERDEQVRFAAEAVLTDIIPSLDNLDLALQHAGDNEVCRDFVVGVRMTRKLLFEALQKQGLEVVGEQGEVFDPAIHEAVGMTSVPDLPPGHVCALVSRGYKLKDRLLRPARVMVSKKD